MGWEEREGVNREGRYWFILEGALQTMFSKRFLTLIQITERGGKEGREGGKGWGGKKGKVGMRD